MIIPIEDETVIPKSLLRKNENSIRNVSASHQNDNSE